MITQEELKELVSYKAETGEMFWLPRPREMFKSDRSFKHFNNRFAYSKAGSLCPKGYINIWLFKSYKAHRLIWLYVNGEFPSKEIDHINGIKSDNRICNLRAVTLQENQKNKSKPKSNTSGHVGVYWHKNNKNWRAAICVNNKKIALGSFINIEDAIDARQKAEIKYGFHENHGR